VTGLHALLGWCALYIWIIYMCAQNKAGLYATSLCLFSLHTS
jgi:hypothetical protein